MKKIIISVILFLTAYIAPINQIWIKNSLYLISYMIVGFKVIEEAIEKILHKELFDETFLMTIATIGAILIGEFPEAVAVMIFYQIGETLQDYAVDKSKRAITDVMNIRPDYANVKRGEEIIKVDPKEVKIGESIVVKHGEKIPLDGKIIEGTSMLDTSSITGESVPREVTVGDNVISGCINQNGVITIKVEKAFTESTVSKILDLVENASEKKSKSENFMTKFAKYYTPIVVLIAVILAIIPPIIFKDTTFSDWLYRALTFLVVSCPCALVISIPLGFFSGLGGASKIGILLKGSNYLEAMSNIKSIIFDKTGTLTEGVFEIQNVKSINLKNEELLEIATLAESDSNHPISLSLKKAYNKEIEKNRIFSTKELTGLGICAIIDDKQVLVGNEKLLKQEKIEYTKADEPGTILYIAINQKFEGYIVISDKIKEDAESTIKTLKTNYKINTIMLTGDKKSVGEDVAKKLEIDEVYTELLPTEKAEKLEEILKANDSGKVVFVGDGTNDAPVLARADVGIAMGALGSDAAIEAADVVIMTDELSKLCKLIKISRKTMRILKENIIFAIVIKIAVLFISAIGLGTMWQAVFADVGVTLLAVLNSLRILYIKKGRY